MDNYVYYALAVGSEEAIAKAIELKMNPNSYNFKAMNNPEYRTGRKYMILVIDADDNYILNTTFVDDFNEFFAPLPAHCPTYVIP